MSTELTDEVEIREKSTSPPPMAEPPLKGKPSYDDEQSENIRILSSYSSLIALVWEDTILPQTNETDKQ